MQRGILTISKPELITLMQYFDVRKNIGLPLSNKIVSAYQNGNEVVTLEISEEELEMIADEIGIVVGEVSSDLVSLRGKVNEMIAGFRGSD